MSAGRTPRWIWLVLPTAVAVGLAASHARAFLEPTFFGDQGVRLDRAAEIVVGVGERRWLPFLQLHIHLLYRLRAPVEGFLLIPYAYTVLTLFLLAWLCRAVLRAPGEALAATALLLVGFGGSSFHWLGRSLYQETLLIPLFLALVGLHYFVPARRAAFVLVLGIGMLTREVFWIWWLTYVGLHWRGRLRDARLRAAVLALGAIPATWLLATGQPPMLARNAPPEPLSVARIAERAASLGGTLAGEWLLPALVLLAGIFALAAAQRGAGGLSFRGFHVFSAVSLAAIYGYVLVADPWRTTPGNTRALVPLFVHVLVWSILGWREATRLRGRARWPARTLAALAMLSMLKLSAIFGALGGAPPPRTADAWEPLRLAPAPADRAWRDALESALAPVRKRGDGPLRVVFVDLGRKEYLKLWVAAFLYDERRVAGTGAPLPAADVIVAPEGFVAPGYARRARLRVAPDATRDVLATAAPAT